MRERDIFEAALAIADPDQRSAYLHEACAGNPDLIGHIEVLLVKEAEMGSFLEVPAAPATVETGVSEGPGTVIGPYKLLEQIGEGGFGVVFMAEQSQPVQRLVALKIIKPGMDSRQIITRFEAERQALAMMDHPNIAKVHDAGVAGGGWRVEGEEGIDFPSTHHPPPSTPSGRPYFVMELVKGVPITKYCDEHQLSLRERLELFIPVCQAVQHAHQKGIIHRDLKPSNVLVACYDDKPVPKVIDFGVAKATGQKLTEKTIFTHFGQLVGTLEYMSPEQAKFNALDIDTRSDIYSLGVLLYELLTGSTPLEKNRLKETAFDEALRIIREEEPPTPSTRLADSKETLAEVAAQRKCEPAKLPRLVRGDLDWIVMKALDKDRGRRYETASAFAADVQHYLHDEPVEACPPSAGYRLGKFVRRNKRALVTGALLFAALLGVAGSIGWAARNQAVRQVVIEVEAQRALKEVQRLQDQGRWPQALEIARQTQTLLESGGISNDVLQRQVRERVNDLRMVTRLEEMRIRIRHLTSEWPDTIQRTDNEYLMTFRGYGLDVDKLRPEEAAAVIQTKSVGLELALALDTWAIVRRGKRNDDLGWRHLNAVARAADPDEWRNHFREAWALEDVNERKASLVKLAASAKVDELLPHTIWLLAETLKKEGGDEQAIAFLRIAQRRHCDNWWINERLARWLATSSPPRYDEAIRYYWAVLASRPDDSGSRVGLASVFQLKGDLDAAITYYRDAIRVWPDDVEALTELGICLCDKKDWEGAIRAFQAALKIDPNALNAPYNLGLALHAKRDLAGAIRVFLAIVKIEPDDADAQCNLGLAFMDQGRFTEALTALQTAHKLGSGRPDWQYYPTAAWVREVEQLIELDAKWPKLLNGESRPANASERLHLAYFCENYKQLYAKAAGWYAEAFAAEPKAVDDLESAHRYSAARAAALLPTGFVFRWRFGAHHYNAARAAALAGCGQGKDAANLDAKEFTRLRGQARAWLGEDLAAWRKVLGKNETVAVSPNVRGLMEHWLKDPDFNAVRSPTELAKLPAGERKEWKVFWQEVSALGRAAGSKVIEKQEKEIKAAEQKIEKQEEEIKAAEQKAAKIKQFLNGEMKLKPTDAAELVGLAEYCLRPEMQLYAASARLYSAAFAAKILNPVSEAGYRAASAAARAGCGQGKDADALEAWERTSLRMAALAWMQGELPKYRKALQSNPQNSTRIDGWLKGWLQDPGFNGVRGAEALAKLPEAERQEWRKLWQEVEGLRLDATAKAAISNGEVAARKAIELNPSNAGAYRSLGHHLYVRQKLPEAEAVYRKIIALNPNDTGAFHQLANVLYLQQKLPQAVEASHQAIALKPDFANAYNSLGVFLRAQLKFPEANAAQQKAIEFNHGVAEANLGYLLMGQGQFVDARAAFARAHELGYQSSGNIRWADQWIQLDAKLPRILKGETLPADAAERFALAEFCQLPCRQFYAASARFYSEAFAADPTLVGELRADIRYDAARAAARAGRGQGKDAGNLDAKEYSRLRAQALAWLRADLAGWRTEFDKEPSKSRNGVLYEMEQWQKDSAFDAVHGAEAIAKLPEAERQEWRKLWQEVEALLQQAMAPQAKK